MKTYPIFLLFSIFYSFPMWGQTARYFSEEATPISEESNTTTEEQETPTSTQAITTILKASNKEARFYRPTTFQQSTSTSYFSLGGYLAANTQYFVTDGEGAGLQFELQDLHIFAQSTFLNNRLQFVSDVAFNPSTQQFKLVEAALNIGFHRAFNLRAGVILPPLGYLNQNGDSPTYDFIDKPLSSTYIIPSQWSEIGFGINGNIELQQGLEFTYEFYVVNGLQEGIIDNDLPRTALHLGNNGNLLGADNNNKLAYVNRVGLYKKNLGEIGFSFYEGAYNITEIDETEIDESRSVSILAIDGQLQLRKLAIRGEIAMATIDVYEGLGQLFGNKQMGYHLDLSYPVIQNIQLLGQNTNQLNFLFRIERADYNIGSFEQTDTKIYDEIQGICTGLALRFGQRAVLKGNYSYSWNKDILGNASKTGGIQFGFASYF